MSFGRFRSALIALVLATTGCASKWDSITSSRRLNPDQGHVLVALSYTGEVALQQLFLQYRPRGTPNNQLIILEPFKLAEKPDTGVLLRDKATGMMGELKLLTMPAGEYEFAEWTVILFTNLYGNTRVTRTLKPVQPPTPIAFSVTAGQINYIGNLHIEISPSGTQYLWRTSDEQGRDLELFRQRGTVVGTRGMPIETRLMTQTHATGLLGR